MFSMSTIQRGVPWLVGNSHGPTIPWSIRDPRGAPRSFYGYPHDVFVYGIYPTGYYIYILIYVYMYFIYIYIYIDIYRIYIYIYILYYIYIILYIIYCYIWDEISTFISHLIWDVQDPNWKYDIVPEIMDGHNIVDFVDPAPWWERSWVPTGAPRLLICVTLW